MKNELEQFKLPPGALDDPETRATPAGHLDPDAQNHYDHTDGDPGDPGHPDHPQKVHQAEKRRTDGQGVMVASLGYVTYLFLKVVLTLGTSRATGI